MRPLSHRIAGRHADRRAGARVDVELTPNSGVDSTYTRCRAAAEPPPSRRYQCTPFMMFAIAICSTFARSACAGAVSPFDAAESGKTL
jgi:hypothetical protein